MVWVVCERGVSVSLGGGLGDGGGDQGRLGGHPKTEIDKPRLTPGRTFLGQLRFSIFRFLGPNFRKSVKKENESWP